jgi:hypothetical protein
MPAENLGTALEKDILEKQVKEKVDARGTYEVLLGTAVISGLRKAVGDDLATEFLDTHAMFDKALENSEIDLFTLMPIHQISAFSSFQEYLSLLRQIQTKLNMLKSEDAEAVKKPLGRMIEIASSKPKAEDPVVTSSTRYQNSRFWGKLLPTVPQSTEALELMPYSYPNFDDIKTAAAGYCVKSGFKKSLTADLNACTKKSLTALALHRKHTEHLESDFRDYLVEAQAYLREHNWLRYGLDDSKLVKAAESRGAVVKIDSALGTTTVACEKTVAYSFLGVNLEMVLRRAVVALANSVFDNFMFSGKQKAYDGIVAASSATVQEVALSWLETLGEAFDNVNKA